MRGTARRNVRCICRIVEVGKLSLKLSHHIWANGIVSRANPHVDFATFEVTGRGDLITAPGLHIGGGLVNGRVAIIHAGGVLQR